MSTFQEREAPRSRYRPNHFVLSPHRRCAREPRPESFPSTPADSKDAKNRAKDEFSKLDGWGWLPNTKYLDKQVDVDISYTNLDPRGVLCTVKFKAFLTVPVAGRLISFFAKDDKKGDEKKWQELLDNQQYALNPALINYSNEIELESDKDKLSIPYITLTSTSAVAIPYSTLKYPISLE